MNAILSLLDNDLYKFTMMQAVWQLQPEAQVQYRFINRRPEDRFSEACAERIRERILALGDLRLQPEEREFLATLPFFQPAFLDHLQQFRLDPNAVTLELKDGQLQLEINGRWQDSILYEVPLMALISQSYFELVDTQWDPDPEAYEAKSREKGLRLSQAACSFMDFGTRRRRSAALHERVVKAFAADDIVCKGSSNVYLAMKYGMQPLGTMAHEWIMGYAGLHGVEQANPKALQAWRDVYGDALGVALTDTYSTELFLEQLRGPLARGYSALRHDSESPYTFAEQVLNFYEEEGIDPASKGIVFSDGLNVDSAIDIQNYLQGRIPASYGIGTHFSNDFDGSRALNMVIKLYRINDRCVAKISDNPGKASGDPRAVAEALAAIQALKLSC